MRNVATLTACLQDEVMAAVAFFSEMVSRFPQVCCACEAQTKLRVGIFENLNLLSEAEEPLWT